MPSKRFILSLTIAACIIALFYIISGKLFFKNGPASLMIENGTDHEQKLCDKLFEIGLHPHCQYSDGNKTVDIAFPESKLFIEVDGNHHYLDPEQAFTDLLRTKYSLDNGIITIHLPNKLIDERLNDCAYLLKKIIIERKAQQEAIQ